MTYATVSTGYKGGGVNPRPSTLSEILPFKPEDLTAYEIGSKTQWFDNRLRLNGDFFVSDYKDLQTAYVGPGAPGSVILNTGHVIIYGTELTAAATPFPGLQIDSTASWLHNKTVADPRQCRRVCERQHIRRDEHDLPAQRRRSRTEAAWHP